MKAGYAVPDSEVLEYAATQGRILLTLNRRDFIRLSSTCDHPGIVVCTQDPDTPRHASRIDAALRGHASLRNAVVRVNRPA